MPPTLARARAALAAAALLPGLAVGIAASSAQAGALVLCDGQAATMVGTEGDDFLTGTDGPDVIVGLGGRDVIDAGGGDDTVCAGSGDDAVAGWAGDDRVFGEAGGDLLVGYEGDDVLRGNTGDDSIAASDGDDIARGGPGRDFLGGDAGADLIVGGPGETDVALYNGRQSGVTVDLRPRGGADDGNAMDGPVGARDDIRRTEGVIGTAGQDSLFGNRKANVLQGEGGQDQVFGRGGDDTLLVGDGEADVADCGSGVDSLRFDRALDVGSRCENRDDV